MPDGPIGTRTCKSIKLRPVRALLDAVAVCLQIVLLGRALPASETLVSIWPPSRARAHKPVYGVAITSRSYAGNGGRSGFLGSGSLRITDLGRASLVSGSGLFLTAIHAVPEPGALAPLGLVMLACASRLRSRRSCRRCVSYDRVRLPA